MMKKTIIIIAIIVTNATVFAQTSSVKTINILTSIQCEMCKEKVGEALVFEKGIKSFDINLETKTVTATFNTKKTSPEQIKKAITNVGYDADEIAADSVAYAKLPSCCKKPTDTEHEPHQ
jgi:periplasmic mercuric ion binding protein